MSDAIRVMLGGKRGGRSVEVLIDPEDFHLLQAHRCAPHRSDHATYIYCYLAGTKPRKRTALARLIMETPADLVCDHINRNPLDNRRKNLRNITQQQNTWNTRQKKQSQSPHKGVIHYPGRDRPWMARMRHPETGKYLNLGSFATPGEARRVYLDAVRELRGSY